jgi:predicted RNase H-like nuclease (RuvC/YqgF family)
MATKTETTPATPEEQMTALAAENTKLKEENEKLSALVEAQQDEITRLESVAEKASGKTTVKTAKGKVVTMLADSFTWRGKEINKEVLEADKELLDELLSKEVGFLQLED